MIATLALNMDDMEEPFGQVEVRGASWQASLNNWEVWASTLP